VLPDARALPADVPSAAMDDNPRTDRDRVISVQLDLQLDREPIAGRLRTERGADERFVGWLGFAAALERLQSCGADEET
jgi:hypothetical protein